MIKPGDTVTWTSQSGGVYRTKTGKVVAIVPRKASIVDCYPEIANVLRSRIKAQQINWIYDRALVQVPRGNNFDYYAPPLGILKVVG